MSGRIHRPLIFVGQAPRPAADAPVSLILSPAIGDFRDQPVRGPAADEGVRPTQCPVQQKTSGIGCKGLLNETCGVGLRPADLVL